MFVVGDIVDTRNGDFELGTIAMVKSIHYNGIIPIHYLVTFKNSTYTDMWISAERLIEYNKDLIRGRKLHELGV